MSKNVNVLKLTVFSVMVAFGVVISPILRIEGMCPMAHFINILCSVLMGPWYSLLCAFLIAVIRMTLMGIPPLALTGAVFGAFLSGVFYRASKGKIIFAVLGEIVGTGIIGAIVSYPVMAFIMGKSGLVPFFYVPSFLLGTLIGGFVALVFLFHLKKTGMLQKMIDKIGVNSFREEFSCKNIFKGVREKNPLIHCISHKISANMCANAILGMGGRACMAEHPDEVEEITQGADALYVSFANISDAKIKSIFISVREAERKKIPVVADCVGVNCASMRRMLCQRLFKESRVTLIKGNYSEIYALFDENYSSFGIDSDKSLDEKRVIAAAREVSKKYDCMVLASGKRDIICHKNEITLIENGSESLTKITGSGCTLGAVCTLFLSCDKSPDAVIAACGALGICGENLRGGSGSMGVLFLDRLSKITHKKISRKIKITRRV